MRYLALALVFAGCAGQDVAQMNEGDPVGGGGVGGGPSDEFNTPTVCTSNVHWTRGDRGSASMHPGGECVSCHDADRGPALAFGGTVYPTAHEPDDCNGIAGGAQVIVTDSKGYMMTATVNGAGNFYMRATSMFVPPFTAKVVSNGKERQMTTPQDNGDCNSCHTETGTNMAPGRIILPN